MRPCSNLRWPFQVILLLPACRARCCKSAAIPAVKHVGQAILFASTSVFKPLILKELYKILTVEHRLGNLTSAAGPSDFIGIR